MVIHFKVELVFQERKGRYILTIYDIISFSSLKCEINPWLLILVVLLEVRFVDCI